LTISQPVYGLEIARYTTTAQARPIIYYGNILALRSVTSSGSSAWQANYRQFSMQILLYIIQCNIDMGQVPNVHVQLAKQSRYETMIAGGPATPHYTGSLVQIRAILDAGSPSVILYARYCYMNA